MQPEAGLVVEDVEYALLGLTFANNSQSRWVQLLLFLDEAR